MPLPVSMDATWLDGAVQFNGQELRRADSGLFVGEGSAPLGVLGGIARHNDNSLAVTVNASDLITIQPGACAIPGNAGVGNGVYRTALGAAETGQLAARNATNPRIDRVIFRVLDTSVVGSHAAYTGRIEVLTGVAAASPAVPDLPTLAIELARITVPATGGGVATVDSSWRTYLAAIGGTLPVATAARLPTTPNAKWLKAVAVDTGIEYTWSGTAWNPNLTSWITWDSFSMPNLFQNPIYRKLMRIGNTVWGRASVSVTSGGSIGPVLIDFPIVNGVQWMPAADAVFAEHQLWGRAQFLRSGVAWYPGVIKPIIYASVKRMGLYQQDGSGAHWTVSTPATFQAGDQVGIDFMYEAAPLP